MNKLLERGVRLSVLKRKSDGTFSCPPAPASVLEKSVADVSFPGLVIDKLTYHLPLYASTSVWRRPGSG